MKHLFIFNLFIALLLAAAQISFAQSSLTASDLSNVRASEVSDSQLRSFASQAADRGMTIDQALQMAQQRGLGSSVAAQLRQRINELQSDVQRTGTTERVDMERVRVPDFERPEREESEMMRRTFGSSVFRTQSTEFTPQSNVPTPASYTMGAGDELLVTIWGDQIASYRLPVGPEGTVEIDNLGPLMVSGLTIAETEEVIRTSLKQLYAGMRESGDRQTTFARVSLNRLRSIQISITGDVVNPGSYAIPSSSTAFNALYRAGGPAENGSYRNIRIVRNNEIITTVDLYDFLVGGIQSGNIHLRDGDVVHVMPYENRVEVIGEAKRGDLLFETTDEETLADLLTFVGGFSENAFRQQIRIHRNTPSERRILTVSASQFETTPMQNGDVVFIEELLSRFENRVGIEGAVWRSGDFELREGMTLIDLIDEAGGLRPDAFMNRGLINRMRDDYTLEQISFDLSLLFEQPGRYNIRLRPEDQVLVRSIHNLADEQTVEIGGAVRNGGQFPHRSGMSLEDLILKADGFTNAASEARIEVSRRVTGEAIPTRRSLSTAEVFVFSIDRDLRLSDADARFELQPYDRVEVFRRPDYREQFTVRIEGEVLFPGNYTIQSRNERISDLIRRAGGLTSEAYTPGARLTRNLSSIDRPLIELDFLGQEEMIDESAVLFGGMEQRERQMREQDRDTSRVEASERTLLEQRAFLNRIGREEEEEEEEEEETRRIGLNLNRILQSPGTGEDLFLRDGDVIRIPDQQQTVAVIGAVMQDVEVRFQEGRSLRYYIGSAGGYTENARAGRAYVVYPNGDVDRRRSYIFGLIRTNPTVQPGAQIIVPDKAPGAGLSTAEVISITSSATTTALLILTLIDRLGN